jgi:hypothetical protein
MTDVVSNGRLLGGIKFSEGFAESLFQMRV